MEELKTYVKDYCGEDWGASIENSESVSDHPVGVSVSQIHLRIVMTDVDGYKTEKIIIFDIPMGC